MKKLAIVFGLTLLMAVPSWAAGIGVGIAHWDTDSAGDDQGLGIKVSFDVGEKFEIELRGAVFDAFAQTGNNALFRLEAAPLDLGFSYRFKPDSKTQPYVGAGGSFIFANAEFDGGQLPIAGDAEVNDEFGFYFVVGADVAVKDSFGVFGEVLFRQAKLNVSGNAFGFTDFEADFTGPAAAAGVMLRW